MGYSAYVVVGDGTGLRMCGNLTQIGSCNKLGSCSCRENAFVNGADADICIKNDDTVLNPMC